MISGIDEDTVRTVQSGRETAGTMLRTAQEHLQKVFIVWVVTLLGTILLLGNLWDELQHNILFEQMDLTTKQAAEIIIVTPFDVILLQVKIGAIVGFFVALPLLVYYSRDALRARGWWPGEKVATWKLVSLATLSLLLFVGGVYYAYDFFFPLLFSFLAENAMTAGFKPHYSIVKWVHFVALLSISFGLAAQLPLVMSALTYAHIVEYDTFRNNWRWAVLIIVVIAAMVNGSPDPFSMSLVAAPMIALYGTGLACAKLVDTLQAKASGTISGDSTTDAGGEPGDIELGDLGAAGVRAAPPEAFEDLDESDVLEIADRAMSEDDPEKARELLDRWDEIQARVDGVDESERESEAPAREESEDDGENVLASTGAGMLNAFTEDETTEDDIGGYYYDLAFIVESLTSKAMWLVGTFFVVTALVFVFLFRGIPGLATAATIADSGTVLAWNGTVVAQNVTVLARHVTVLAQNGTVLANDSILTTRHGVAATRPSITVIQNGSRLLRHGTVLATNATSPGAAGTVIARNTTVLVQNHTAADSISGIGILKNAFVSHLPPGMRNDVQFITLHPVEHLIFIVKFSVIIGLVSTVPILLYFAWPAMEERGFVGGNRNTLVVWGGTLLLTLVVGSLIGFLYVAPTVISWLAYDVLQAGMIISYRVATFGWLVLMLTVGIGLLIEIPVTMFLFHRGGIVTFQTVQKHWRAVTLAVFLAGALASPKGVWVMFIIAIPLTVAFLVGLGLLWIYTLGGRRTPKKSSGLID